MELAKWLSRSSSDSAAFFFLLFIRVRASLVAIVYSQVKSELSFLKSPMLFQTLINVFCRASSASSWSMTSLRICQ
jgi:hypothetical protein